MLGTATGASKAETFWTDFLRSLARRGLRGVKLVISDSRESLKAAVARVLHASWQRCHVGLLKSRSGLIRSFRNGHGFDSMLGSRLRGQGSRGSLYRRVR